MRMKYVVVNTEYGNEAPIMFPETLSHTDVCQYDNGEWVFKQAPVVSAGFVSFYYEDDKIQASCHGESTTLKIKSRKEDDALFNYFLNSY